MCTRCRSMPFVLSSLMLAAPAGGLGQAHAQAQPPAPELPTAVIVFDNSGSMWGKIDGAKANKLDVAREAMGKALDKVKGARLGLVTFGRRRGDCGDIELVARPEAGDPDRINDPLDRLNPKGKGPVVQATREAAKAIGAMRPASIVLIHDDPDNCQQDPCAAAQDIRRDAPGVRVHVVSIGMKKEDAARMSCLAEMTGGRQFDAQNAVQLTAMIDEAVGLAVSGAGAARAAPLLPPPPTPAARPMTEAARPVPLAGAQRQPTQTPEKGPPGLWMSAVQGVGGPLIEDLVIWRVNRVSGGVEATVFETTAAEPRAALPPGSYTVEARYGLVTARRSIEVGADRPTAAVVAIEAAALRMLSRAQSGGAPLDQVTYSVYDGGPIEGTPLWIGRDPAGGIGLKPGAYRVVAERGLARGQATVTLTAGKSSTAEVVLGAGLLSLRAVPREDGEVMGNAVFIVSEDAPDQPQGRREVTRSAAPAPDFVLPAGTYTVTARAGGGEVRGRVAVGAGEAVRHSIVMALGKLTLNARIEQSASTAALREPVAVRLMRPDGEAREAARLSGAPQTLDLPAGAYKVELQAGEQNVRAVRDIEIQAGRTAQLSVELQAARLSLRLADSLGGATARDLAWEVRDDADRLIWRQSLAEPRLLLAPGRYSFAAIVKDRRVERSVLLRNGEVRSLEIGAE